MVNSTLHNGNALDLHILHDHGFAIHQPMNIALIYQDPVTISIWPQDIGNRASLQNANPVSFHRSPFTVPTGTKPMYRSETKNAFSRAVTPDVCANSGLPFPCFSNVGFKRSKASDKSGKLLITDSVTTKQSDSKRTSFVWTYCCNDFDRPAFVKSKSQMEKWGALAKGVLAKEALARGALVNRCLWKEQLAKGVLVDLGEST